MLIVQIYSNQYRWRRWSVAYSALGDLSAKLIIDLGCGIGDQARDLARLGANVLGIDSNQDVIDHANRRGVPRARFLCSSITNLKDYASEADGIWASFTVAYFPQFAKFLDSIEKVLKPGGWLAITEVDDLLGHEPLDSRWVTLIERYYGKSLEEGVYRFRSCGLFLLVHPVIARILANNGTRRTGFGQTRKSWIEVPLFQSSPTDARGL